MNVLITGGAGYLGSTLARILLDKGHKVRALDSLMHGGQSVQGLYQYDGFSFMRGDIRDPNVVEESLENIDSVVHLAAIVGDPACARQPEIAKEVNRDAALQLYDLSRERKIGRFIFSSTCSNYGKMSDPSAYATEESQLNPISLYAETKVAVENRLLDVLDPEGTEVTVLRFATLFGISPRMRFDLTVNTFTMEFLMQGELKVFGEQFWRPYVHVLDAARAIALVLKSQTEKVNGRVFNVGDSGQNFQKGQLASLIQAQVGDHLEIHHVERDEDPRDYRVSFEKIQRELGFEITRTIEDGVREIADAIKQGVIIDLDNPKYTN